MWKRDDCGVSGDEKLVIFSLFCYPRQWGKVQGCGWRCWRPLLPPKLFVQTWSWQQVWGSRQGRQGLLPTACLLHEKELGPILCCKRKKMKDNRKGRQGLLPGQRYCPPASSLLYEKIRSDQMWLPKKISKKKLLIFFTLSKYRVIQKECQK